VPPTTSLASVRHRTLVRAIACALLATASIGGASAAPAAAPVVQRSDTVPVEDGLRQVVDDALAANLQLRAGSASVAQRMAALDQARARYLPVLDFAARYSVADGGRSIDIPVGDLLNPVYVTLEQLTGAQYPRVENQSIDLLRAHEQETKLVLAQPVYEPRIGPAVETNRQLVNRSEADLEALRSRVIRDTKQAYYEWLAAQQQALVLELLVPARRREVRVDLLGRQLVRLQPGCRGKQAARQRRRARRRRAGVIGPGLGQGQHPLDLRIKRHPVAPLAWPAGRRRRALRPRSRKCAVRPGAAQAPRRA